MADDPQKEQILAAAQRMLDRGTPPEQVKGFIQRARSRLEANAKDQREAQQLSGGVKAASLLDRAAGSASFGVGPLLGDAIAAGLDPDQSFSDLRSERATRNAQLGGAGLLADLAGGLVTGGASLSAIKGAANLGRVAKVGLALADGAAQGGVTSAAEGLNDWSVSGARQAARRGAMGAAIGGTAGGVLGGVAGAVGRRAALARSAGETSQAAKVLRENLAEATEADIQQAMGRVGDFERAGRGADVMPIDALGTPGQNLARAASNMDGKAQETLTGAMRGRDADVVRRTRADLGDAAGFSPQQMDEFDNALLAQQKAEANANFGRAREEGAAWDAGNHLPAASARPTVEVRTGSGRLTGNLSKASDDDLAAEYARLMEANSDDVGMQGAKVHEMGGGPQFGVYTGMGDAGMKAGGRIAARQKSIAKIEAELSRRGMSSEDALWLANKDKFDDFDFAEAAASGPVKAPAVDEATMAKVAAAHADPIVQRTWGNLVKQNPSKFEGINPTSWEGQHKVYTEINKAIRAIEKQGDASAANESYNALLEAKTLLNESLAARSPSFRPANEAFADVAKGREAYKLGQQAAAQGRPTRARALQGKVREGKEALFRKGFVDDLAEQVGAGPSPRLDAAAAANSRVGQRAVRSDNAARMVKDILGEDALGTLAERAKAEGVFAQSSRAVQGNSTTARQVNGLADLLGVSTDVAASFSLNPKWWMTMLGRRLSERETKVLMRGRARENARTTADALTRKGAGNTQSVLQDLLNELQRQQRGAATGRAVGQRARGAVSRASADN